MFIRRTTTRQHGSDNASYFTHRLVRSERLGGKVRQITLLNLGAHFALAPCLWPAFCARLAALISLQPGLIDAPVGAEVEALAQRYAAQLQPRVPEVSAAKASAAACAGADADAEPRFVEVDIASLTLSDPRSVGVEALALAAITALGIDETLTLAGLNGPDRAAALGLIVARIAAPGSERHTHRWLQSTSALGELLAFDYEKLSLTRLYQAGDRLLSAQTALESTMYARVTSLFSLTGTIALYDLTNTYFEGIGSDNLLAKRGFSKEKRSDCPLLTLALVLDGDGFVRKSETFAGNVGEAKTLALMLKSLGAPNNALVVMDRGIVSAANLTWLRENNYRYLVMDHSRKALPSDTSKVLETAQKQSVTIAKTIDPEDGDVRLLCFSEARAAKEQAMLDTKKLKFEAEIGKLNAQIKKQIAKAALKADAIAQKAAQASAKKVAKNAPEVAAKKSKKEPSKHALEKLEKAKARQRAGLTPALLNRRIGRLTERYSNVAQHYTVSLQEKDGAVTSITASYAARADSKADLSGHYALRSNDHTLSDEQLWRTYITLTELESAFRSLKSELGLRPIHHQIDRRCRAHLFISVLAYQCVHFIRTKLARENIHERWGTLRKTLEKQRRVTTTFTTRNGDTLHVRKTTQPCAQAKAITQALKLPPLPGKITRRTFRQKRDL
jgi:transposase